MSTGLRSLWGCERLLSFLVVPGAPRLRPLSASVASLLPPLECLLQGHLSFTRDTLITVTMTLYTNKVTFTSYKGYIFWEHCSLNECIANPANYPGTLRLKGHSKWITSLDLHLAPEREFAATLMVNPLSVSWELKTSSSQPIERGRNPYTQG